MTRQPLRRTLRSATKLAIIPLALLFWVPVVFMVKEAFRWIS